MQSVLQPITVINPFAEQLKIPTQVFKKRRTNAHYLAFIEVITFFKQYEREQKVDTVTGEVYIETTIEDIEEANELLKQILLRKSDELNGATRNYFEELKQHLVKTGQSSFTSTSIRNQLRIPISSVKRYHAALMDAGLIKKIESRNTKAWHYEIIAQEEYNQLQNSIATALDEALQKIQQPTSPTAAQSKSEPRKRKPVKELEQQPTAL